jgi:Zn-dependent protease
MTGESLKLAVYLALSLAVAMIAREYARAWAASRLGDVTPRLWGRITLNPKAWFDPFGSGLLPALILVLWAAQAAFLPPPVAYAKPAPVDPSYLRRHRRDTVLVSVAGPVANVLLAIVPGLVLRADIGGELGLVAIAFLLTNVSLAVFHLMPIPGLDGARMVALVLPPRAAEVYRNLDNYLALFVLLVLFLLAAPFLAIVDSLSNVLCELLAGFPCR